jgi:trehalose 6-phosphate phosphatase
VVVAGDDRGDLAAFAAVEALAAGGVDGLRVAVASPEAPPELLDRADLAVDGPEGMAALLARWADAAAQR